MAVVPSRLCRGECRERLRCNSGVHITAQRLCPAWAGGRRALIPGGPWRLAQRSAPPVSCQLTTCMASMHAELQAFSKQHSALLGGH